MLLENLTKQKLGNGETVYGCFMRQAEPTLAEFVAMQGWDFLIFDGEHGSLEVRDIEGLSRACELHGVTPIARVSTNQPSVILRFLDAGAHGVQVPWVNTAAAAEQAVKSAKYGPRGERGLAGSRQGGWGLTEPLGDYTQRANRETMVIIHIETAAAAAAIEDYTAIEDVDVLFIGPTDLSHSLGHPGNPGHPDVVKVMDRVTEAVVASDKALGIFVGTRTAAAAWQEKGATYIATGLEGIIKQGIQAYLPGNRQRSV
ncbi:MAG: aldolase/citrate lyase family protein [Acidimicrobiia bacterium]|nr:aldolase/citrate lyase family protein [Acidimicrobiia bacterium]MDX2467196.1 aldolase/citrate lyase family protein [Acidimicrobiia bacterium]